MILEFLCRLVELRLLLLRLDSLVIPMTTAWWPQTQRTRRPSTAAQASTSRHLLSTIEHQLQRQEVMHHLSIATVDRLTHHWPSTMESRQMFFRHNMEHNSCV